MNYEVFKTNLFEILENRLGAKVRSWPEGASCPDPDGLSSDACVISIPYRKLSPVIYPDFYFNQYSNGSSFEEIVENVLDIIRYTEEDVFDFDEFDDYYRARTHIVPRLIRMEGHQQMLEKRAFIHFLNMAVVFIYVISNEGDGLVSFAITDEQLSTWGVSKNEMFHDSIETAKQLFPSKIESISEILPLTEEESKKPFYVITNSKNQYGAVCVLYDEVLSDFAGRLGESFYLIPSSVHEMLILPESFNIPTSDMSQMLSEVNNSVVEPEEVLSDRVYYYDMESNELEFAS